MTSVYNVLNRFPKDLYEQYKSDLARVPDGDVEDALKLLQRPTFSQRKLRLEEVVDLLAVDTKADFPVFNVKEPTIPHSQILVICGSLVRANINKAGCNDLGDEAEVTTLTVFHSTVLEFLTSQPIKIGSLPEVSLAKAGANLYMAEASLGYLHTLFDNITTFSEEILREYPSARLCAEQLGDFYREIINNKHETVHLARINRMIIKVLDSPEATLKWVQLCDPGAAN